MSETVYYVPGAKTVAVLRVTSGVLGVLSVAGEAISVVPVPFAPIVGAFFGGASFWKKYVDDKREKLAKDL